MFVLGANGAVGGYNLKRSLRFRASASAHLTRTPASAGNRQKWTYSGLVKRGSLAAGCLLSARTDDNNRDGFQFSPEVLQLINVVGGATDCNLVTTAVYRDPSSHYHIVLAVDTTQATSTNRVKLYVNGEQVTAFSTATYPTLNSNFSINNTVAHAIGRLQFSTPQNYFDGYLTEVNFIDGQALTPSSFGEYDTTTGVWKPKKYSGTYGTNGFYLDFEDNSGATATTIGKDSSGNGNNWTPNNISVTAGVTYDSMTDVPTLTSATAANYATFNPLTKPGFTDGAVLSNGNLRVSGTQGVSNCFARSAMAISGKIYAEFFFDAVNSTGCIGVVPVNDTAPTGYLAVQSTNICYRSGGNKRVLGTETAYGASWAANNIIGVAVDTSANTVEFFKNGTSQGVITSSAFFAQGDCTFAIAHDDVGSPLGYANFGQRPFAYTPPTGFVALNAYNLPDATIRKGSDHFNVVLDTGANIKTAAEALYPSNFFEWIKDRANANNHQLIDIVRGTSAVLQSNTSAAETTYTAPTGNSVGFAWKAGGAAVSNNAGSVTSQVSANASAGFSIVSFNSGASGIKTVGHGLGVTPKLIITKNRQDAAGGWLTWHTLFTQNEYLILNGTAAKGTATNVWGSALPTSSVFGFNSGSTYVVNNDILALCFAEIDGYSKFGSYVGNGSADGPFVYTGFKPKYVMMKASSSVANGSWILKDTSRNPYNAADANLYANLSNAEDNIATVNIDILSNGFKLRGTFNAINDSSATYIFAAFAENPFKNSLAR